MKKLLLILLLTIPFIGFGQISLLDKKNGFKDIKLGTNVLKYKFIKKCKSNNQEIYFDKNQLVPHPFIGDGTSYNLTEGIIFHEGVKECHLWFVDPDNEEYQTFPNNNKIDKIFVETYNNLILSITIYIDYDLGRDLPNTVKKVFGSPTKDICKEGKGIEWLIKEKKERCQLNWTTNKIDLMVMSYHHLDMSLMTHSIPERTGWIIQYKDIKLNSIVEGIKTKLIEKEIKRSKEKLKDQF